MRAHEELAQSYLKKRGKRPASSNELLDFWYLELLAINPNESRRRELVVDYAESKGGITLSSLKGLYPHYWGDYSSGETTLTQETESTVKSKELATILVKMRHELGTEWPPITPIKFPDAPGVRNPSRKLPG